MTDSWHGGKGSRYRKVDQEKYNENWERIFGKKKEAEESEEEQETEDEAKTD
jgi:hypothetical protein